MVDKFVVAVVDKIYKEGTQDAETARPMVEKMWFATRKRQNRSSKTWAPTQHQQPPPPMVKKSKPRASTHRWYSVTRAYKISDSEPKLVGSVFNKEKHE